MHCDCICSQMLLINFIPIYRSYVLTYIFWARATTVRFPALTFGLTCSLNSNVRHSVHASQLQIFYILLYTLYVACVCRGRYLRVHAWLFFHYIYFLFTSLPLLRLESMRRPSLTWPSRVGAV